MREQGVPTGAALQMLSIFGAGIQTFDPYASKGARQSQKGTLRSGAEAIARQF
jgi:hypothetical protein